MVARHDHHVDGDQRDDADGARDVEREPEPLQASELPARHPGAEEAEGAVPEEGPDERGLVAVARGERVDQQERGRSRRARTTRRSAFRWT